MYNRPYSNLYGDNREELLHAGLKNLNTNVLLYGLVYRIVLMEDLKAFASNPNLILEEVIELL